jgi:transcriptional regulator with XRE-family HTH domain
VRREESVVRLSSGEEIRKLRLERKLSQGELAAMTDLSQRTISQIENGRQKPHPKTLSKIIEALTSSPIKGLPGLPAPSPVARRPRESRRTRKMPDKVAKDLMSVVDRLASKYARWSGEADDLRSVGQDALFEAWNMHKSRSGLPFETFAAKRIEWRISDMASQLSSDPTTTNYGFEDMPRYAREWVDAPHPEDGDE